MNLFQTRLPNDRLHKSFKQILNDPNCAPVRDVIQAWGAGLLDRRGEQNKFVTEFQTTFNSSFWELYLNKAFFELGFSVDYTKSSPDFCVTTPGGYRFNVEAVIADQPHGSPLADTARSSDDKKSENALKLAGKIRDKLDIFTGTKGNNFPYSTLGHVQGRPFVIAIAPFNSDHSLMQNNEIINQVLFGIDSPDISTGNQKKILSVSKPSGAPVAMGIFTNDSYKEISAVFFRQPELMARPWSRAGSKEWYGRPVTEK